MKEGRRERQLKGSQGRAKTEDMEVIFEHCCGLDVHKETVTACLIGPSPDGKPQKEIRTYGTMSDDLIKLRDWLSANGCTHVAMESTGVYWKPIYNILEDHFHILLVNAKHIKAVPGRKTDVCDAEWIAKLLRHGLLKGSFIPPKPIREMRDLTRYRTSLIQERAREIQRVQKVLEDANIKLASVATDISGVSGRAIIQAIISGQDDPKLLTELARGRLRSKTGELERALKGMITDHHRLLLTRMLAHIEFLDQAIEKLDAEIEEKMRPFAAEARRMATVPGIKGRATEEILAETGTDMSAFPTSANIASWAGVCPGNNESAGKRKSGKTRPGNPWLRAALVRAAWAASRTKGTYFHAQYNRLVARRGKKKAILAVAHALLVVVYHVLREGTNYRELGYNYFDRLNAQAKARYYIRRVEEITGRKVNLVEPDAA